MRLSRRVPLDTHSQLFASSPEPLGEVRDTQREEGKGELSQVSAVSVAVSGQLSQVSAVSVAVSGQLSQVSEIGDLCMERPLGMDRVAM